MKRRSLFLLSLLALAVPQWISHSALQAPGFGTIQVTVVREGTNGPIRDVKLNLTGASGMGAQQGQSLLNAVSRGIANDPAEALKNAQDAVRDGPKKTTAVSDSAGKFTFKSVPIRT